MLEVRLLGSVEVCGADGRRLSLGGGKPLAILGALAVHLGEVLSTERLVDLVWEERVPATASALVATHVSAVRRALSAVGEASVIRTRTPGYVMELPASRVDTRRFEETLTAARRTAAAGRTGEAAEHLSDALRMWRGRNALEGLGQSFARIESARLAELRLVAEEERFGLELALGRENEAVAPLLAAVAAHPLRERFREHLMTALFRTGRAPDALRVYREGREILRAELGIDPGPGLRALQQAVLRNDAAPGAARARHGTPAPLTGPPGRHLQPQLPAGQRPPASGTATAPRPSRAPSHLPPDTSDFVGRAEEIAWATALLEKVNDPTRTAPPMAILSGRSGVGKTALAVHVGHRTAALFPDGRLFLDLRASDSAPVQTADALARLLRALGVDPETDSSGLDDLIGRYRTHVAGRRILLVLDNALGEAHLRPLLPPGPGSAVLVTSRRRLVALEGAAHLDLAAPGEEEALRLLAAVAGAERTARAPIEAAEIVALCGRLPLALRIAGARLAARPHWALGRLAERLRDERRRLNELRAGDLELRASLELGYADLDPQERRALRWLALMDLPDFAAWIAAPLLDIGAEEAEETVERLVDCHFVEVLGVDGTGQTRYRIQDLAREHARERCLTEEDPEERTAAVLRLVACWLTLADRAALAGPGGAPRHFAAARTGWPLDAATQQALLAAPAAWFAAEQACLVAAVAHCAGHGMTRAARDLAGALIASSAALYNQFEAWSRSHTVALDAVRHAGDGEGEAWLLTGMGQLRYEQDRFEESYAYFSDAARLFGGRPGDGPEKRGAGRRAPAGDSDALRGSAASLAGMGMVRREQARFGEALHLLERSLAGYRELDDEAGTARVLYGLGYVHREQGRADEAWMTLSRALTLYRAVSDRHGEALTLRSLALCHRAAGAWADAAALLAEALEIFTDLADSFGEMYTEQSLAKVELRQGHLAQARRRLDRCLAMARQRRDDFGEALVLRTIGELHLAARDPEAAEGPLRRALAAWETLGLPLWRARTVRDLAEVHALRGNGQAAAEAGARALRVFRALGSREAWEIRSGPGAADAGV